MRSRGFALRGFALENDSARQQDGTPSGGSLPASVPAEDYSENVETRLLDIEGEAADGEQEMDSIDDAVAVTESLALVSKHVSTQLRAGRFSDGEAQLTRLHLESLYERVGFPEQHTAALEGMNSLALESEIGNKIKALWEKIKAAFKRLVEWAKGLWSKLFKGSESIIERAGRLAKQAESVGSSTGKKGSSQKQEFFANGEMAKALHIEGTVPKNKLGALVVRQVAEAVKKEYVPFSEAIADVLAEMTKANGEDVMDKIDVFEKVMGAQSSYMKVYENAAASGIVGAQEGDSAIRTAEMPGGKALQYVFHLPESDPSEFRFKAGIADYKKGGAPGSDQVPVFDWREAVEVAQAVIKIAQTITELEPLTKKVSGMKDGVLRELERGMRESIAAQNEAGKNNPHATPQGLHSYMVMMTKVVSAFDVPQIEFSRYALTTCKHLLDQVDKSNKLNAAGA